MPVKPTIIRLIMKLRQKGITDRNVLAAIERIPRELFVPTSFYDQAYEDIALPIGNGQTISQPTVVAFMTQKLEPDIKSKVLEIGTGCGYQAAVLSRLFRRVYTIERYRNLLRAAEKRFIKLRLNNIIPLWADGNQGWPDQAPFDRIILTAGTPSVPNVLFEQLSENGILIAPVGYTSANQKLVLYKKNGQNISAEKLWAVRFVPVVSGTVSDTVSSN
ncbi:MAG: protein-L-isoaspartate O-methyltransferase [Rhodospirillaceae bacterium]|nr:protein-L-isoaspartate O-methyltransferase [Rhodospirillaceae bacterium]